MKLAFDVASDKKITGFSRNPADKDWDWTGFENQWKSWRQFRQWQRYHRRAATLESLICQQEQLSEEDFKGLSGYFRRGEGPSRVFLWAFQRTSRTYTEAMEKLLAEYGFTRPFQLHEDPAQQDELTTWIEYLGYNYAQHYFWKSAMARLQPEYEKRWKALVDTKVLRPETERQSIMAVTSCPSDSGPNDLSAMVQLALPN